MAGPSATPLARDLLLTATLAVGAGVAWWGKMGVIAATGVDGAGVAVAYLLGLALLVAGGAAAGWLVARRAKVALRALAAVAGAAGAWVLHQAMDVVGEAMFPGDGWFHEEASVWLTATVALAAGSLLLLARRPRAEPPAAA